MSHLFTPYVMVNLIAKLTQSRIIWEVGFELRDMAAFGSTVLGLRACTTMLSERLSEILSRRRVENKQTTLEKASRASAGTLGTVSHPGPFPLKSLLLGYFITQ